MYSIPQGAWPAVLVGYAVFIDYRMILKLSGLPCLPPRSGSICEHDATRSRGHSVWKAFTDGTGLDGPGSGPSARKKRHPQSGKSR